MGKTCSKVIACLQGFIVSQKWASRLNHTVMAINKSKTGLTTSCVCFSVFLLPLPSKDVHAYIDPGTGSLILQVLIASFVGALFFLKIFWGKVKAFFSNLFSRAKKGNG